MPNATFGNTWIDVSPCEQRDKVVEVNQYTSKPTNPDNAKCSAGFQSNSQPISFMNQIIVSIYS